MFVNWPSILLSFEGPFFHPIIILPIPFSFCNYFLFPGLSGEWMHELGKDDMELLVQLGTLSLPNILSEVKN